MAENRLASRGTDVWLGLEPGDGDADRLTLGVAGALEGPAAGAAGTEGARTGTDADPPSVDPEAIAAAVWQRAPAEVCLVLDDGHVLAEGSGGAAWVAALVDVLPANAQLLLASGDPAAARDVAHRAMAIDEWSEGAYGVLVGAALAQGQRSTAHRLLQRCLAALADLGVTPTEPTLQLRRRLDQP
jgi:hypothetical protein